MRALVGFAVAGASLALAACSHVQAPPPKVAPAAPPEVVDRSIGTATMLNDGTIVMQLRTSIDSGPEGRMTQKIKPSDMQYAQVLKRLGGLKPGQTKPITDYPVQ
jgi:hypothetical protein